MNIVRCHQIEELRARALPYLLANEAEHGLLIGLILAVNTLPDDALAAIATDDKRIHGVAVRLDHRTIVSRVDDAEALDLLADTIAADAKTRMIAGAADTVAAAINRSDRIVTFTMNQRVYATSTMTLPSQHPPGRRRAAEPRDRETLIDGHLELHASLGAHESRDDAGKGIDRLIASGALSVWETPTGEVVCTAGSAGPTPNGIRVNYVYTPVEQRGKGYASTLVRDLTQSLLASGRSFVFLHADVANPTACALYERIGYARVADFTMIRY